MKAFIFAILLVPLAAFADYTYDWTTGNSYNTTRTLGGGARVNGYNGRTGSSWNTTIRPNGDMNGTDSGGNYWNYNNSSGSYTNSNGSGCFGKGAGRTCW